MLNAKVQGESLTLIQTPSRTPEVHKMKNIDLIPMLSPEVNPFQTPKHALFPEETPKQNSELISL